MVEKSLIVSSPLFDIRTVKGGHKSPSSQSSPVNDITGLHEEVDVAGPVPMVVDNTGEMKNGFSTRIVAMEVSDGDDVSCECLALLGVAFRTLV